MVAIYKECDKQFHNKSNLNCHLKAVYAESEESDDDTEEIDETSEAFDGGD